MKKMHSIFFRDVVHKATAKMYTRRKFVSHVWDRLSWFYKVWWVRLLENPEVESKQYVPQYLTSF